MDFKMIELLRRSAEEVQKYERLVAPLRKALDTYRNIDFQHLENLRKLGEAVRAHQPALAAIAQNQALLDVINQPGYQALQAAANAFAHNLADYSALEKIRESWGVDSEFQRIVSQHASAVAGIEPYLQQAFTDMARFREFEQSFAGKVCGHLVDIATAIADNKDLEAPAEDLAAFLEDRISRSPKDSISREGWIQIILAIAFFIIQWFMSNAQEDRLTEKIEQRLKDVVPAPQSEAHAESLRLVNAQSLRVRQAPSTDAPIQIHLGMLSLVRIIDENKSWALVEYFDLSTGEAAQGWVAKRFLIRLPEEFTK